MSQQSVQVKVVQKFDSESNSGGTVTTQVTQLAVTVGGCSGIVGIRNVRKSPDLLLLTRSFFSWSQVTVSSNAGHGGPNTTNVETNVDIKHEKKEGYDCHRMPDKPMDHPLHHPPPPQQPPSQQQQPQPPSGPGNSNNESSSSSAFPDSSHDPSTLDDHDIKDILQMLEDDNDPSGELPPDIMMAIEQIEEESVTGKGPGDAKLDTGGVWSAANAATAAAAANDHPPFVVRSCCCCCFCFCCCRCCLLV